jgi:hypothetical protein
VWYTCLVAHTSGTFATDLAAVDWIAGLSLAVSRDARVQRFATPITVNQTITLPTAQVYTGLEFVIERPGTENFSIATGVFTIPAGVAGTLTLRYDGAAWQPSFVITKGLTASVTWNPASLASGSSVTTTVSVYGAAMGTTCVASFSLDLQGLGLTAYVSVFGTVTVVLSNLTGIAVDLGSGTLRVDVSQP